MRRDAHPALEHQPAELRRGANSSHHASSFAAGAERDQVDGDGRLGDPVASFQRRMSRARQVRRDQLAEAIRRDVRKPSVRADDGSCVLTQA